MNSKLPMIQVESSNIKAIGYEDSTQKLDVEFNTGTLYRFFGVDMDIYNSLLAARSKGSFFSKHIRGKFESQKLS